MSGLIRCRQNMLRNAQCISANFQRKEEGSENLHCRFWTSMPIPRIAADPIVMNPQQDFEMPE
jgi:hypothetical protein